MSVARVLITGGNEATEDTRSDVCEHSANNIGLEEYATEFAFLPDLTEEINKTINYNASNVADPQLSTNRRQRLVATLKNHKHILIASGNALPLPAYGAVCDIDTQGNAPIKQRARRVPLLFLGKLYELLRALLRAGRIIFSDSPWAPPIVIVMKKNGMYMGISMEIEVTEIEALEGQVRGDDFSVTTACQPEPVKMIDTKILLEVRIDKLNDIVQTWAAICPDNLPFQSWLRE
ncbi:hypothetical protein PInf_008196 [Phytophthora infestans]|nr:hypothetical protein PInf_008196 [Phytophthora infestans]